VVSLLLDGRLARLTLAVHLAAVLGIHLGA
jgi:hypothetical protein